MAETEQTDESPIVIKKYANRRLYNTETSSYVTLDHLADLVRKGRDFVVKDARSGEDITRSVLTQIIFELESQGQTLLPVPFLRQLIGFYGDRMQSMVPGYLQCSMEAFARNQEEIREAFEANLDPARAMSVFEDMTRQNMAFMENAMRMFSPFGGEAGEREPAGGGAEGGAARDSGSDSRIETLEQQLAAMQAQLDAMRKDR